VSKLAQCLQERAFAAASVTAGPAVFTRVSVVTILCALPFAAPLPPVSQLVQLPQERAAAAAAMTAGPAVFTRASVVTVLCALPFAAPLQVSQLAQLSQERAAAAAAAAASVAAERVAQQLLAGLKAADAEAQERLQDLCKCIEDAAAQVRLEVAVISDCSGCTYSHKNGGPDSSRCRCTQEKLQDLCKCIEDAPAHVSQRL
jgi:hypothetical protein